MCLGSVTRALNRCNRRKVKPVLPQYAAASSALHISKCAAQSRYRALQHCYGVRCVSCPLRKRKWVVDAVELRRISQDKVPALRR